MTSVPFVVEAPGFSATMSVPHWNTNALHAPKDGHSIVTTENLLLDGSYLYYADVKEDHVDQLKMDLNV